VVLDGIEVPNWIVLLLTELNGRLIRGSLVGLGEGVSGIVDLFVHPTLVIVDGSEVPDWPVHLVSNSWLGVEVGGCVSEEAGYGK